jgi:O-antigen ligase
LNGLVLAIRFFLISLLPFYVAFSRKNQIRFSPTAGVLLLLPITMLLNSVRAYNVADAVGQSILFMLMYISLVLGGQKILGDERGRAIFTRTLILFSIVMACIQIPSLGSARGRLEGVFENVVGFMTVGMFGVIILFWFMMKQRFGGILFLFFGGFTGLTLVLLILTAGRTALGGAALGIAVILSRKLRRNAAIFLVISILFAPVILKTAASFPGFEAVKSKLFSERSSGRGVLWQHAWEQIKQKPVFGWGTQYAFITSVATTGLEYHNSFLEFACDHGIPFAIVMLFLFLWYPFRGLYLMRHSPTEELKDMANLSSAFLAALVFSSFLGGGLLATTGTLLIYTAIGLQEGIHAECKKVQDELANEYLYDNQDVDNEQLSEQYQT